MRTVPPNIDKVADATPSEGDARAAVIERLFREHNEALVRFLRGRVGSHSEALEVAQEAYVRLLSLDQPGAVSYLRAFLFKTAANIAIDRFQGKQAEYEQARTDAEAAEAAARKARKDLDAARDDVASFARDSYMSGSTS